MIIVTGGAGFIGSNIVKELNNRGRNDILIVDNLGKSDKYKNLIGLHYIDYLNKEKFFADLESYCGGDVEAIFHEGACSDTMEYDVNYMIKNNYETSKALLKFCDFRAIPLIYASSASTYGGGKNGFFEDDKCEDALNPYAFSKLLFDRYVRQFIPNAQTKIIGLRYFNVYGPQEAHKGKMASIFYQLYNQIKATGSAKLFKGIDGYNDGEQLRDFVYVKDVVKVNLWCLDNNIKNGVYNCGTGQAHTFNEAAQAVINAVGTGKIEYRDFPDGLRGKYQSYTQADVNKLIKAGYDGSFTDINQAVKEYCQLLDKNGGYYSYVQ
ncbi:MAG: ADP-glyceromanno-heptose 6-epimerase [Selenomonadaceae bacterium]|nr:ADP-glyceromanno-heptose 6-epimerase [Selenomonadaceae bacterium]